MPDLGRAHARFARAVILIYLGTGAIAVLLLVAGLLTDLAYHQEVARNTLLLETEVRAHYLAYHLRLLIGELRQLSMRSEINPPDRNIDPERVLLRLAHEKSSFFNVGVAVIGPEGLVLWAEPESFLPRGLSLSSENWYQTLLQSQRLLVVPVQPEREKDSMLYVVAPVVRDGMFAGALLGAVDLAMEGSLGSEMHPTAHGLDVLATRRGAVIYPAKPPSFSLDPRWTDLVRRIRDQALLTETSLTMEAAVPAKGRDPAPASERMLVAGSPVAGTEFLLLSLADADQFFRPARDRMKARMGLGLLLFVAPLLLLVVLLRRSFRIFRQSEEWARRDERLRMLGEAVSLIAHEVRNSLNGLRMGLELILQGDRRGAEQRPAAAAGLRAEIERLSSFTTELLGFSKGVVPRPISLDLAEFGRKVTDLARPRADSLGISLALSSPAEGVRVKADPSLIHVVVANLVGNALDALAGDPVRDPSVQVTVERSGRTARLQVRDNGPGVPLGIRPRLFDPFVTGKPSGVGIGLAFSRKIARAHGGELTLEPAVSGAAFLLTLPLEAR